MESGDMAGRKLRSSEGMRARMRRPTMGCEERGVKKRPKRLGVTEGGLRSLRRVDDRVGERRPVEGPAGDDEAGGSMEEDGGGGAWRLAVGVVAAAMVSSSMVPVSDVMPDVCDAGR